MAFAQMSIITEEKQDVSIYSLADYQLNKHMEVQPIQKSTSASLSFSPYESVERQSRNSTKIKIDLRRTDNQLLGVESLVEQGMQRCLYLETKDERDVIWNDNYISQGQVRQLHFYQRINHFPGSYQLGRKSCLAQNLEKMKGSFKEEFSPATWLLPKDSAQLRKQLMVNKDRILEDNSAHPYYIAKPEASSQGKGIFLFNSALQLPRDWQNSNLVVQKYIQKPYLIDGLKFDFRIYVLLRSINPLRVYIYKQGLTRFATYKYQPPNESNCTNVMMHLTNYAINKRNPQFVFNSSDRDDNIGHKRSYTSVIELLKSMNVDTQQLQSQIDGIIVKTILSGLAPINEVYKRARQNREITSVCFELLGFDIMIDRNLTPYLIEVNHTPSFVTDTPLDYFIKKNLIQDTLNIIRTDVDGKKQFLGGKNLGIDKLTSHTQLRQMQIEEDYYQDRNRGGFRKIFPSSNPELTRIHDQILGLKPPKLYRINYQSLNKSRISQLNKRNKSSVKHFRSTIEPLEPLYDRNNQFESSEYDEDKRSTYKIDRSMPLQSLMKSVDKTQTETTINQSTNFRQSKMSYKNMWIFSRLQKNQKYKELQPLRLKEMDFYAPPSHQVKGKNAIPSTGRSLKQYTFDTGSPLIKQVCSTTKNILYNFHRHKRLNEQVESEPKVIAQQALIQPRKITTLYKNMDRLSRSVRFRQPSQIKPSINRLLCNYSRKFSYQEKRLIMGYD